MREREESVEKFNIRKGKGEFFKKKKKKKTFVFAQTQYLVLKNITKSRESITQTIDSILKLKIRSREESSRKRKKKRKKTANIVENCSKNKRKN